MNTWPMVGAGIGGGLLLYVINLYALLKREGAVFPFRSVVWLIGHGFARYYNRRMIHAVDPRSAKIELEAGVGFRSGWEGRMSEQWAGEPKAGVQKGG